MGAAIKHPEISGWIRILNQIAGSTERTIARSDYSLEEIFDAEGNSVEVYGFFREVRGDLMETSTPRMQEALKKADSRMKAARDAAREAYEARRERALKEAEQDAGNVTRIERLDKEHQRRETQEQHADTGA